MAQASNHNQNTPHRFISLKFKWATATAVCSLIISLVVIVAIYNFFMHAVLQQEEATMTNELTVISRQLDNAQLPLTRQSVRSVLEEKALSYNENSSEQSIYRRPLLRGLSNSHLNVFVYDKSGKLLFATGKAQITLKKTEKRSMTYVRGHNQHRLLLATIPIGKDHHQPVGYLQMENHLNAYYQLHQRLLLVISLALCLVFVCSALAGYFISAFFLQPIDDIEETLHVVSKDPSKQIRVPDTGRNDELGELSRVFNEMLDQTHRYIEQQSQFVGDVSHELRTPVAVIQGQMEMLQRWGKDVKDVREEAINASLSEIKRMNSLINEMLDLSRAEGANLAYPDATTKVEGVVQQVFDNFKMLHADFRFTLDDDLRQDVSVKIFHDHLVQILVILCDNAVKYSTDRKEIHISLSRTFNNVEIGVQDFGEGISKEELDKVFDRFYRVDKARSRKRGGNGLGLSIAKRLVEEYHGSIAVESQVGSGSVFKISLPIAEEDQSDTL